MLNYFYGIILIFLSILPGFGNKNIIENYAKQGISNTVTEGTKTEKVALDIPSVPEKNDPYAQISIASDAAVFIDVDSGKILYEKSKDARLPMASTTKLMTALVVYEKLGMDKVVTVPTLTTRPLDSVMGISAGQQFKVSELMHGLLIESGSDAAHTLAVAAGGDEHRFVALMNEKAALLGLTNTQYTNSVGYDDTNHYSSAYDLAKLAKIALKNKVISDITAKTSYVATSESGQRFPLSNTNKLLNGTTYKGLKTGTTLVAGECLVSYYENGNQKIIGVVLKSPSRFYETDKVIQWVRNTFKYE